MFSQNNGNATHGTSQLITQSTYHIVI